MDTLLVQETPWWQTWVLIPMLILVARVADQTMGTLRVIFVSKGHRLIAPVMGFVEAIIWLVAVSQILRHVGNPLSYIAYGGGFALGNYFGILVSERISLGRVIIRVVSRDNSQELVEEIRKRHFGLTVVDGHGANGPVQMLFSIIERRDLQELLDIITKYNPNAFYSVEEVKVVREGVFRPGDGGLALMGFGLRKAK